MIEDRRYGFQGSSELRGVVQENTSHILLRRPIMFNEHKQRSIRPILFSFPRVYIPTLSTSYTFLHNLLPH